MVTDSDASSLKTQAESARQRFIEAYLAQRNDDAVDIFLEAVTADPSGAFRDFAFNVAGQLSQALVASNRVDEAASRLDPMIVDHPSIHLICPNEPETVRRMAAKREEHIRKGLPSMVLASMGKSASIAVANIFNSGFELPTFSYSLFHMRVIDSWARDFARGGASYTTHLDPSRETVSRLKQAGISRLIVHVRDPRQALLSIVHHFDKYPDQLIDHREQAKDAPNLGARAMSVLGLYSSSIKWIRGWLDLEQEIDILFSTFEDFVRDRAAFVERYLQFYGVDRAHFSWEQAFGEHTGIDEHFRRGLTDEWRQVFSREEAEYLSSLLPLRAKERFGWWDSEETPSVRAGGSSAPTHRDRVLAWLKETSEPGDAAAREEVDRRVAAGDRSLPADIEERAARAELRDYPDQAGLLIRLWQLIMNRDGQVPDGLAIHALRSRLAELSRTAAGVEPEARDKERLEIGRELAILEIFEAAANGSDVKELLLCGKVKTPDAPGYAKLGHELTRRCDFDAAEVAYLLAIELGPASSSLHRSLADVIDANGRSKEAVEILENLAAQAPHDPELHARLGHVLIRSGDLGRAETVLHNAITIDAAPMHAYCDLADVLAATGRPSEAAAMLQALVAQGTTDNELHARLSQLLQRHPAAQTPSDQPQLGRAKVNDLERQPQFGQANVNDLERHLRLFKDFLPFSGFVPKGFLVDFLGSLTDANFRSMWDIDPGKVGGADVTTSLPDVTWGEGFFEIVDWFEAALEARVTYTMVTLGACYGSQAVGAYLALQRLNPMPCRLVAVEAEPGNFTWLQKHFRDNGVDPQQHWLLNCALSDTNKPVLFPVGESGSGVNNCFSTNEPRSRQIYAERLSKQPQLGELVYNLILEGKTGIEVAPVRGKDFRTAVEFVSAVTLNDVLAPLGSVDLLESDIQQSEIVVFPPAMDMIEAKVKRIHLGTHGASTHAALLREFVDRDFEIIFNYPPNSSHETPWGSFSVNDGIITARNPRILR